LVVYWVWMLVALWVASMVAMLVVYLVDQWAVDWVYYSVVNSADWSVDKWG
jgi:hypothetical protein